MVGGFFLLEIVGSTKTTSPPPSKQKGDTEEILGVARRPGGQNCTPKHSLRLDPSPIRTSPGFPRLQIARVTMST